MAIRTIFSLVEDCARGERLGWQEFVRDYAGVARSLMAHYFPALHNCRDAAWCASTTMTIPELEQQVVAVFRRAGAQDGSWFAGLRFTNEREFLMAFRELVFAYGREQERLPAPEVPLEQVRTVMGDLSLLEREMLWLVIKGYDAPRIAAIMMFAAATAEAVQRMADQRLPELASGGTLDAAIAQRFAIVQRLMTLAEQSGTEQCASLKTFNNLVNGQITWRERELAEEHMNNCFYCIDRFTSFQEMIRIRKDVVALGTPQVEAILAQLPFLGNKPRTVLSRLFARG